MATQAACSAFKADRDEAQSHTRTPRVLSDLDLVAGVFFGAEPDADAVSQAASLMERVGSLAGLRELVGNPVETPGLYGIHCLAELTARVYRAELPRGTRIETPHHAARYLFEKHGRAKQEVFGVLYLDVGGRTIADEVLFVGGLSRCLVDPKIVFARALRFHASAIIIFHTHPSGCPRPSQVDFETTKQLRKAGELLKIMVFDHLIIAGPTRLVSMRCDYWE